MKMVWHAALLAASALFAGVAGTAFFDRINERARLMRVRGKASGLPSGPLNALRASKEDRSLAIERDVPQMIDALALSMRAGLSFESAWRMYCFRFDDELALACRSACLSWESGLSTRDEALAELGRSCAVPSLERFVGNVTRCLHYGTPMTRMFEVLAAEARGCYRAKMEEKVARAPVKMLVPTAALILPAMLIFVMGPVMLEFI